MAQQGRHWVFGDSVGLEFTKSEVVNTSKKVWAPEGVSTYSDSTGKLLYYATPEKVFFVQEDTSFVLKGGKSSAQGALIVKHPNGNHLNLLVSTHVGLDNKIGSLYSYSIDEQKKSLKYEGILLDHSTEQLNAVNHQNNRDIWISSHDDTSQTFYFFLVKNDRILECPVTAKIGARHVESGPNQTAGICLKFSPRGDYLSSLLVFAHRSELLLFNSESADLKWHFMTTPFYPWSAEFSPDGSKWYISADGRLYQYDLSSPSVSEIKASEKKIDPNGNSNMGAIQLALNRRIYVAIIGDSNLDVVNNPNLPGTACDYQVDGLVLDSGKALKGLPNFNQSIFYTPAIDFAYTEDCWEHKYTFEGRDTLKATTFKWLFTNGGYRDSFDTKHCTYQFPDTGTWQVSHIVSNGSRSDTITKELTIRPRWRNDMLGKDTFYCLGDTFKLVLETPKNMHCVHWMGEEPNLDTANGPLLHYNHFHTDSLTIDTAGEYFVKVTNKTFCRAWDTITVYEDKRPQKPEISYQTEELASTIKASGYRWYLNDTFLKDTESRSIKPQKNGYYQVKLFSEHGCESERSDSFLVDDISIEPIVGLQFKVYPNPSRGLVTLEFGQHGSYSIDVFDMTGRLVDRQSLKGSSTTFKIDQPGHYLVKVKNQNVNIGQTIVQIKPE
ncbi:MAG: T9SS type A sorting domain-containing protein [Bacteroidia bacterium]|nr:T9SS type A sorting domain-containing protein [Bacteroidia bacterium]